MKKGFWKCTSVMAALIFCLAVEANAQKPETGLVAHEWGTFTSIAGNDGEAVSWYPWGVPSDLPKFVEEFAEASFKPNLSGTIRMETPVLYFYSAREAKVSVHVSFSKGLITEWYPRVARYTPNGKLTNVILRTGMVGDGSVTWDGVEIQPGNETALVREAQESRYYAARATAAAPLEVRSRQGAQREKFLFYRGVSSESSPVTAQILPAGGVLVTNRSKAAIPAMFVFERRGDAAGFTAVEDVSKRTTLPMPELNRPVEKISEQMIAALTNRGLYADEARAMLETWKDTWFEEGTRLLYIVPNTFVERVLPLAIRPEPAETKRVFVGRLELVPARTRTDIETALKTGDEPALAKYNRFLWPMLEMVAERETDPTMVRLIRKRLEQPIVVAAQTQR